MEINILEDKKKRLVFELKGEKHTICNALREELWNDKSVTISAYNISHPLIGIPKFIIERPFEMDSIMTLVSETIASKAAPE